MTGPIPLPAGGSGFTGRNLVDLCWADGGWGDGSFSCVSQATSTVGLCAEHYAEIVGNQDLNLVEPGQVA